MTTSLGVLSFARSTSSERMKMVASVLASKSRMRSSSLPAMTRVGSAGSTIHASASSGMPGAGVMEGTGVMEAPGVTDAFGAVGSPPSPSSGGADGGVSPPSPLPSGGADGGVSPPSPLPSGGADGGVSPPPPLPSGGADGGVSPPSPLPSGGADGGVPSPPCGGVSFAGVWGASVGASGVSADGLGASVGALGASVGALGASVGGAAAGCGVSTGGAGGWPSPPSAKAHVVSRQMASRVASRRFISRSLPSFRHAGRGGAVFLYTRRLDMAFGCHSREKL